MAQSRSRLSSNFSALGLFLVLIGWIMFAPAEIGGSTSYIILVGNSMEPQFNRGDLVLVRETSYYQVGDIVAYEQPEGGTIFHRIVNIDGDSHTMSGDHNVWNDSYHPTNQEIIGKLWIHVPVAGKYLMLLRTPAVFSFVVIFFSLLIIIALSSNGTTAVNKKSYNHSELSNNINKDNRMEKQQPSDTLFLILAIAFISIILAISSFSQTVEEKVADNIEFKHNGTFEYYSFVPKGVYEDNILESGDPVYRQLNNSININFSYELTSDEPVEIYGGTYRLLAEISETNGWNRTLEIIPPSLIVENSFTSAGILDIADIEALIDNLEKQTEVFNNRYTLSIRPEVYIQGEIDDREFEDTFTPELNFSFDNEKMVLDQDNEELEDILNPVQTSAALGTTEEANSISILGLNVNVLVARIISVYGILGSILAIVLLNKKNKKMEMASSDEEDEKKAK